MFTVKHTWKERKMYVKKLWSNRAGNTYYISLCSLCSFVPLNLAVFHTDTCAACRGQEPLYGTAE